MKCVIFVMQYWKQAAKQHQHNNDCPNSFYYNITVQLVCRHVNTSSRPLTISFPWRLVDGVMFPWKASSPLSDCSTISHMQVVGLQWCPGFVYRFHLRVEFSSVPLLSYAQALPRLHARITDLLPLNFPVSEICRDSWDLEEASMPLP